MASTEGAPSLSLERMCNHSDTGLRHDHPFLLNIVQGRKTKGKSMRRMLNYQYTIRFMIILSLVCATILSFLSSALKEPKNIAKELDRNKQMLIAARIMNPYGYFQIKNEQGEFIPAKVSAGGILEPINKQLIPNQEQFLEVYRARIQPFLVDDEGHPITFQQAGIDEQKYIHDYRKIGYYQEPLKLIYKIYPNAKPVESLDSPDRSIEGYVIPVNGMGLWDAIYGYLAIKPDGNTVIGISWYDHKETPDLGAKISEPEWQSQFPGKRIFQESASGQTDFKTAPLGIIVVKGKVKEALNETCDALSAVDGMAGATETGNGVTHAYRDVLSAYRPFLIHIHDEFTKNSSIQ